MFFLTSSQNDSIIGLSEYAHTTWLMSMNQDLALIFWGAGKLEIAFSKFSQGVTLDDAIWRSLNRIMS